MQLRTGHLISVSGLMLGSDSAVKGKQAQQQQQQLTSFPILSSPAGIASMLDIAQQTCKGACPARLVQRSILHEQLVVDTCMA